MQINRKNKLGEEISTADVVLSYNVTTKRSAVISPNVFLLLKLKQIHQMIQNISSKISTWNSFQFHEEINRLVDEGNPPPQVSKSMPKKFKDTSWKSMMAWLVTPEKGVGSLVNKPKMTDLHDLLCCKVFTYKA